MKLNRMKTQGEEAQGKKGLNAATASKCRAARSAEARESAATAHEGKARQSAATAIEG